MSEKAIIYNRTSSKDQNPELQLKKCKDFAKENNLEIVETVSEQKSAFKKKQEKFDYVTEKAKKNNYHIIVYRYDRAFRDKKGFYLFMREMFEDYDVKIYSATEESILTLWNIVDSFKRKAKGDDFMYQFISGIMKQIWQLLIQMKGEEAEEEAKKIGERVKNAIRSKKGKTVSYKGNKWGRKKTISKRVIREVVELKNQGYTMRQISSKVKYTDKNNNQKNISLAAVYKILREKDTPENSNNDILKIQQIVNKEGGKENDR